MAGHRLEIGLVIAALAAARVFGAPGAGQSRGSVPGSSQSAGSEPVAQTQPQNEGSPSGQIVQRKTGPNSSQTIRRTRVPEEEAASPELAKAEELIQKQDYASAEPLLRKAVVGNPADYVAWFDLGFVENKLGKVDDSIAAYRKSVAAKPDVFESNLSLGVQLARSGQADAEQFLRAATELKPTDHVAEGQERAWLSLAHVLEATRPEEAIAAYRRAAILQPRDAEPHLAAGMILEKLSKPSDAIEEYKQAFALDPASDALAALANIYMRGRRFPEAEEYLRKLAAVHPDQASIHIQLGRVLAAQDKNDAAIAELEAGAKLAPGDDSLQRELAELYSSTGKNGQAEGVYRSLLRAHPADAGLHHELGKALLRQKKFRDAQQEFLAAVKLKPDLGQAYGDLAFAASENRDYPLVISALNTRAKFLPEGPITYFFRASAYDHLKDFKQAAVNYHLFLKTANGKYPDQEWQAKHRLIAIEPRK